MPSHTPEVRDDQLAVRSSHDIELTPPVFAEIWNLHASAVARRCRSLMSGVSEDAEDAFGRTALLALQKYTAHRDRILDVRRWLLRVAHNVCMDLFRERERRARRYDLASPEVDVETEVDILDAPRDQRAALLDREQLSTIHAAVAALIPRLREPLELRLRDLSDRDIAEQLGISEAAVRKRLQDARAALRPVLLEYEK